jgi:hypothetical protein
LQERGKAPGRPEVCKIAERFGVNASTVHQRALEREADNGAVYIGSDNGGDVHRCNSLRVPEAHIDHQLGARQPGMSFSQSTMIENAVMGVDTKSPFGIESSPAGLSYAMPDSALTALTSYGHPWCDGLSDRYTVL